MNILKKLGVTLNAETKEVSISPWTVSFVTFVIGLVLGLIL